MPLFLKEIYFLTLQVVELETPMVIALNQMDIAERKGILLDHEKLQKLSIPIIPIVTIKRIGIYELIAIDGIASRFLNSDFKLGLKLKRTISL